MNFQKKVLTFSSASSPNFSPKRKSSFEKFTLEVFLVIAALFAVNYAPSKVKKTMSANESQSTVKQQTHKLETKNDIKIDSTKENGNFEIYTPGQLTIQLTPDKKIMGRFFDGKTLSKYSLSQEEEIGALIEKLPCKKVVIFNAPELFSLIAATDTALEKKIAEGKLKREEKDIRLVKREKKLPN